MIHSQETKYVSIARPAALVDAASVTTTSVDTKGWDYCTIVIDLGATDIALSALKLQESDTDSDYADLLVYGTSEDISGSTSALPSATDDNNFFLFEVDLRGRKRYLDLVATVGDGTAGAYVTAHAVLSRGSESPVTATERGVANVLRV